jgi:hypothetical protein
MVASSSQTETLNPAPDRRDVLTHSSRRVGLDHGLNADVFERAFRQLCFDAATV